MRILPALLLALCSLRLVASEFQAGFDRLVEAKANDAAIEAYLDAAQAAQVDNPEWYVDTANHFARKASEGVVLSRKPAGEGDLALTDPKTGEAVGSSAPEADAEIMKPAIAALVEGVKRFPARLDIRFGLARLNQEVDDFDRLLAAVDQAAVYAVAHPADLRWRDGAPLDQAPERFVPQVIQNYALDYYDVDDAEKSRRFLAVCQIGIARFPRCVFAYNSLGAYWYLKGEHEKSLGYLLEARKLEPKDAYVLLNLGRLQLELGHVAEGRAALEAVAGSDADDKHKAEAKRMLAEANDAPAKP